MQMLRQVEFSLFDFLLHQHYQPEAPKSALDVLKEVRETSSVVPYPAYNQFPCGFSHIFAGGYAAGYFSYKWAEVLSSDAYARFEEEGLFDSHCGQDFLHEILQVGGSRDAMESFKAFRGREPQIDALLRHNGIKA
jgi:oligopeptidase A